MEQWVAFLLAVQFLTRLPIPPETPFSTDRFHMAMGYLPLVGAGIGAVGACTLWLGATFIPMPVAVLLSIGVTLLITGALHEDGLADAADGLGGGATREKALDIMRDSNVGSYGVLALGITLGLKATALMAMPLTVALVTIIVAHVLSRGAVVLVIARSDYARAEGQKFAAPEVSGAGLALALGSAGLALLVLGSALGVGAAGFGLMGATILGGVITWAYLRKLGGFTGDCLGATQQMAELGMILGVLAWL